MPGPRVVTATIAAALAGGALAVALLGSPGSADAAWRAHTPSPFERTEVGAARAGRFAYVVGGFVASGTTTPKAARYDLERDRWGRIRKLPVAVNHAGVTSLRGRVYVHGGFRSRSGLSSPSARLYRYDPKSGRWRRRMDSPEPRAAHALVAAKGKLYALGGTTPAGSDQSSVRVYSPKRDRWRRAPALSRARNHLAAGVVAGRIYAIGGRAGGANLDVVESWRPGAECWRQVPPIPTARSGFAVSSVGGRLVAFGGEELTPGGRTIAAVEAFDPDRRRWSSLAPMRTPRHGLGAVPYEGRVFALEGGPEPGFAFSSVVESLGVG